VFMGAPLINGLGGAGNATAAHPVRPVAKVALTSRMQANKNIRLLSSMSSMRQA